MPAQEASSRPPRPVSPRRQQRQQDEQIQLPPKPGPQLGSNHSMLAQASPKSLAAQAQLWQAESEQDAEAYGELLTLLRRSQCGMRAESLLERLLQELCELRAESMTYGAQSQSLLVGVWHAHTTIALATCTAQPLSPGTAARIDAACCSSASSSDCLSWCCCRPSYCTCNQGRHGITSPVQP
jgi:hypothetical protein